jgi:6-phosphogluconolactonase
MPQSRVCIGTYTGGDSGSRGIYMLDRDDRTGALSAPRLAAELDKPSFLAVHPARGVLYAVGEVSKFSGRKTGVVSALAIDPSDGSLSLLGQQPSGGVGPCHLSVDPTGRCVLVANYGGGSIARLPMSAVDGSLGPPSCVIQHQGSSVHPQRQQHPHAHSINSDPSGRYALVCDLGLDKVLVYRLDQPDAGLAPHSPPAAAIAPGSGPRHLAWHTSGRCAYVINELTATVTALSWDAAKGTLREIQSLRALPQGYTGGASAAEIAVDSSGRILLASNRGHDSLAVFRIDPATGMLSAAGHVATGKSPRHFAIDPTGRQVIVANQGSSTLVVFALDVASATLTRVGSPIPVPAPVCVRFVP